MRGLISIFQRIDNLGIHPTACFSPVVYRRTALTPLRQHPGDRPDDADIAGAAAEIAAELAADARLVGPGQAGDDVARGGEHAGGTEAALEGMLGGEGR